MDCLFCKIVNKDIPCYNIYEDDTVLAFLDINPLSNGHTLIVPKNHTLDFETIDNDTLIHIFDVARIIKKDILSKLNYDGMKVLTNTNSAQDIKHFHLHLIPVYKNNTNINVEDVYNKIKEM